MISGIFIDVIQTDLNRFLLVHRLDAALNNTLLMEAVIILHAIKS